jgi:transposase
MAFREVLVTQVREVLRAWLAGAGKRPAARRAGVDVKTAARYIAAARAAGLARDGDESQLIDELLGQVVAAAVRPARTAGHGASWEALVPVTAEVTGWVKDGLTLVKIGELVERRGIAVPYRTLARFAAAECGYSSSRQQVTVPVADGKPGEEVQIDFGYLGMIGDGDRRRKLHALVFTAVLSRYCFVFLTFSQTTAAVIAGCEEAWSFFEGVFKVLIVDNLKPVVDKADRLEPRWNREWLEYAQARTLAVDPARVRSPQGQGAGRKRGEVRPGQLLRRGAVRRDRRRAAPGGGLVPGAGRDAGARHYPAPACGGVRGAGAGGAGAAARAGAAVPDAGLERGQGAARLPPVD